MVLAGTVVQFALILVICTLGYQLVLIQFFLFH